MKVAFLIAGVQKGATSALYHYLRQHRDLWLPRKKELHFFDNEQLNWCCPQYDKYHASFQQSRPTLIMGEATPIYTYWRPAAVRIHTYNPQIKLIVSLRDPVARAYSHWRMEVVRGHERLSFPNAIRTGRSRVTAEAEIEDMHRVYSYVERGFYSSQIERLLRYFPSEQILFVTRQDLRYKLESTLDSISAFLGVRKFSKYPRPKTVFSHAHARVEPMCLEDIRYLRTLFHRDLKKCEALIGRTIQLEK